MERLSVSEAKRLSLLKWEAIVRNEGRQLMKLERPEEIENLLNYCGFCERHRDGISVDCSSCEINMGYYNGCNNFSHHYFRWMLGCSDEKLAAAQAVLGLINSVEA